jgi:ABC-type transport system involved in multi-copper enzyme maturation permease subunit
MSDLARLTGRPHGGMAAREAEPTWSIVRRWAEAASMRNVLTVAHLTLVEARRRRIVLAGALCAFGFLAVFAVAVAFAYREMAADPTMSFPERQATLTMIMLVGFMAANFLCVMFAILLPVDTLSGEIDSGVMQTIASKPLGRGQIVIGKWVGHLVLALAYLLAMSAGILLTMRVAAGFFPQGVALALPLLALEIALSLTIALAGGARFSTVTNGILALGVYGLSFIGGFVEQIGGFGGVKSLQTIGIVVSLISPADSMWRLAAHHLQPELLRGLGGLALGATVPSTLMIWWAAGFTTLTLFYAVRAFRRRAL